MEILKFIVTPDGSDLIIKAKIANKVVGIAVLHILPTEEFEDIEINFKDKPYSPNIIYVDKLYINEEFQSLGYGKKLFQFTINVGLKHGTNFFLSVVKLDDMDGLSHQQLINFYKSFGFVSNEKQKNLMHATK